MFVFEPLDPENAEERAKNPTQTPINYTNLTATIKVSENVTFEKSKTPGEEKVEGG